MRPAMLFGTFQIINIYIDKCVEKRCRKVIEPNLNDAQCGFRPGPGNIDQVSLSSKFLRNLGSMPKTSTHALSNSRKHTTGFLLKRFVERCGSMVLTVGRQVTVFLIRSLCPRQESKITTVHRNCGWTLIRVCAVTGDFHSLLYIRPAQFRKLERPNYQHKFAAGCKCLFHFDVDISL